MRDISRLRSGGRAEGPRVRKPGLKEDDHRFESALRSLLAEAPFNPGSFSDLNDDLDDIRGERAERRDRTVTTSPLARNRPVAEPTPEGVPVAMMSPGSRVSPSESTAIKVETSKSICERRADCAPRRSPGSRSSPGKLSDVVDGDDDRAHRTRLIETFPLKNCRWRLWRSRAVRSLRIV